MNKTELLHILDSNYRQVQPSECWAMYRLITPVVDFANQRLKYTPYFEYNQTSDHGTYQSVDIVKAQDLPYKESRLLQSVVT